MVQKKGAMDNFELEHLDVIEDRRDLMKTNQIVNGKHQHRNPFEYMAINDNNFLMQIDGRSACPKCGKSRKFFCYTCYVPVDELARQLPTVQLPIQIDIIKHQREVDGKSTAIHASILAPANVNIYTYPNIPDYDSADDAKTVRTKQRNQIKIVEHFFFRFLQTNEQISFILNIYFRIGFNIPNTQFNSCGWHFR